MKIDGINYTIDSRRIFSGETVPTDMIPTVLNFSYEMCFGNGHHRSHRSGGQKERKAGELFCNTFQGKLAEDCVRKAITDCGIECSIPDFSIYGEGIWDDIDLSVKGSSLSIKSAASFANLLLLETKDFDETGQYIPNIKNNKPASYDYFILARISPDIKSLFKSQRLYFSTYIDKSVIEKIINGQTWHFDIAGWISNGEFIEIIRNRQMIPQGAILNRTTRMDAENYYVQSGDLHPFNELLELLKK